LVANNTCLPEIGGNAVVGFDPFDTDEMAAKIRDVLDSPALQKDMIDKGQQRIELFTWKKTAVSLIEIFKKAAVKT
jgi:glycosyltransferase involved in cell wall biosynthesis